MSVWGLDTFHLYYSSYLQFPQLNNFAPSLRWYRLQHPNSLLIPPSTETILQLPSFLAPSSSMYPEKSESNLGVPSGQISSSDSLSSASAIILSISSRLLKLNSSSIIRNLLPIHLEIRLPESS